MSCHVSSLNVEAMLTIYNMSFFLTQAKQMRLLNREWAFSQGEALIWYITWVHIHANFDKDS